MEMGILGILLMSNDSNANTAKIGRGLAAIRERLSGASRQDVVMTGTDEHAQLTEKAIRGNGGIPNSVKTAVDAIHNREGSEMRTRQNQEAAPKQMRLNGVEPGSVAKAVRNIENSQGSELQTQQNREVAPKQMRLNGRELGSVAKAIRNIENSQAPKGRPAGLDERNDRGRALVRG